MIAVRSTTGLGRAGLVNAGLAIALACIGAQSAVAASGAGASAPIGPVQGERYRAVLVRLGAGSMNGVLYSPTAPGSKARVAIVYASPVAESFAIPAEAMASRGYHVLASTHYSGPPQREQHSPLDGVSEISIAIGYLRSLPGVRRVVLMGHSDGGRLAALYANVAEHGPLACQRPEVLYPCRAEEIKDLARPDGVVMLDPDPGAFRFLHSIDPAYQGTRRVNAELDIYAAANGYDAKSGSINHSDEFTRRYQAAQAARFNQLVDDALGRLQLLQQDKGDFANDEPLTIAGTRDGRLYYIDVTLLARTKRAHTLLKADGSISEGIISSIRPAIAPPAGSVGSFGSALQTSVREFLANNAIRATKDFAVTVDDIIGVDWKSSNTSTPANATGIAVPTLLAIANCSWLVVPGEIIHDRLAAKDKTFVAVEGALHDFSPCKPEYAGTQQRLFDFVDAWISRSGRF